MTIDDKNLLDDVWKYISNCNNKELYFIQKTIEYRREELKTKMFEGSTKL